jgi:hypothetical protein
MKRPTAAAISASFLLAFALPADAARAVSWADLRPQGQHEMLTAPVAGDAGRVASDAVDGDTVEITGFLLPSDREGDFVHEFLLVPWAGACSHTPAPAPNQVLRVHPGQPFLSEGIYEVVTVTGRLSARRDLAQVFIFDGVTIVESAYTLDAISVIGRGMGDRQPARHEGPNPWGFLNR